MTELTSSYHALELRSCVLSSTFAFVCEYLDELPILMLFDVLGEVVNLVRIRV